MTHTATGKYMFRKADGKARGTQGWRAEHESSKCTVHTGLWRGNKVIALLVVKGDYDEISTELKSEGEFIVRACNAHDALFEVAKGILVDDLLPLLPAEYVAKVRAALAAAEIGKAMG